MYDCVSDISLIELCVLIHFLSTWLLEKLQLQFRSVVGDRRKEYIFTAFNFIINVMVNDENPGNDARSRPLASSPGQVGIWRKCPVTVVKGVWIWSMWTKTTRTGNWYEFQSELGPIRRDRNVFEEKILFI